MGTNLNKLFCSGINIWDLNRKFTRLIFEKEEGKLFSPLSRTSVTTLTDESIDNLYFSLVVNYRDWYYRAGYRIRKLQCKVCLLTITTIAA